MATKNYYRDPWLTITDILGLSIEQTKEFEHGLIHLPEVTEAFWRILQVQESQAPSLSCLDSVLVKLNSILLFFRSFKL